MKNLQIELNGDDLFIYCDSGIDSDTILTDVNGNDVSIKDVDMFNDDLCDEYYDCGNDVVSIESNDYR